MPSPALLVLVRFKSRLSVEEAMKVAGERAPEFRALTGLQQKYYTLDSAAGEFVGLYLWDSVEDFGAYRDSQLRASIAEAYQVEGEPRVEVYQHLMSLRDG